MAKFQLDTKGLNAPKAIVPERVRMGSISLFALVIIICMAVLAVLSLSTANASLVMSQRQAVATSELYLAERSAQEFVAGIDGVLAGMRGPGAGGSGQSEVSLARDGRDNVKVDEQGFVMVEEAERAVRAPADAGEPGNSAPAASRAVSSALESIRAAAYDVAGGKVSIAASVAGDKVSAEFACENGRVLGIVVAIRDDGTYRIDRWKMSAVQNQEEPNGQLLIVD